LPSALKGCTMQAELQQNSLSVHHKLIKAIENTLETQTGP